jgi:hypothetical protein
MTFEDVWTELEQGAQGEAGTVRRRVKPESSNDFYAQLRFPERLRSVALRLHGPPGNAWKLARSSRGLIVRAGVEPDGTSYIQLEESDAKYREVFSAIVDDVLKHVDVTGPDESPLDVACGRIKRWQAAMEATGDGVLGEEKQEGLFAELLVLADMFISHQGAATAVESWTGPSQAVQDFQWAAFALEVKSSRVSEPQDMQINGERQLGSSGHERLFLTHVGLDRRSSGTGRTLPEQVRAIRVAISKEARAVELFEDKLLEVGYLGVHENQYDRYRYSIRRLDHFEVVTGFPRITEQDIDDGIGQVNYKLSLSACQSFVISDEELSVAIGGE